MRSGLIVGIVAIAAALGIGALLASWDDEPSTAQVAAERTGAPPAEGRASASEPAGSTPAAPQPAR